MVTETTVDADEIIKAFEDVTPSKPGRVKTTRASADKWG